MPKAGKDQVVIKNHAVAVNPVDWKIQDYDFFVKYPTVLGTDVAGEVHEVGEGVTHVKKGDRVLGHAHSLIASNPEEGGFNLFTLCNALVVQKIPSSMDYTSATVLPLAISTAATCLFKKETIALPLPTSTTKPSPTNKSVLVWGGSSSVGAVAIQLAVGAGVKVVSVASAHNLDKLKELGAYAAFDYKSSSVTDDIIKALEGTEFAGVCDCIGSADSAKAWTPVYKKHGGRYGSVMPAPDALPEGIEGTSVMAVTVAFDDKYVGEAVWAKWVPEALADGTLKAVPTPKVVGKGLKDVQKGLDVQRAGVSFEKVVVEL